MSAAAEIVPMLGAFGAACGALGGVVGKWLAGRSKERTVKAAADSRLAVAEEVTGQHAIARDAALSPVLMDELRTLRREAREDRERSAREREECRRENDDLRRIMIVAGHDLEQVRDEVREANARAERAEERCAVLEDQLLRWHGALPAGSD